MIEKCCGNPLSAVSVGFLSQVQTQMNCLYLLVVDVCQHTGISFPPGSLNQAGMSCSYERKKSCFIKVQTCSDRPLVCPAVWFQKGDNRNPWPRLPTSWWGRCHGWVGHPGEALKEITLATQKASWWFMVISECFGSWFVCGLNFRDVLCISAWWLNGTPWTTSKGSMFVTCMHPHHSCFGNQE